MKNLNNKIVLITGASSGIGKACAEQFAALGANLILAARRVDRIEALAKQLKDQYQIECLTLLLDVSNREQVKTTFENLSAPWNQIDILVNNAGLALGTDKIQDSNIDNWETMLKTNVLGLLYVTHAIIQNMIARNQGHVINIGSVAGIQCYPGGNVYCATKFAVRSISESLKIDLLGTNIRVTEIQPGAVETEFSEVRWKDKQRAKDFYQDFTPLKAEDIADAVVYAATRPDHVNICNMLIYPVAQASASLVHRGKK